MLVRQDLRISPNMRPNIVAAGAGVRALRMLFFRMFGGPVAANVHCVSVWASRVMAAPEPQQSLPLVNMYIVLKRYFPTLTKVCIMVPSKRLRSAGKRQWSVCVSVRASVHVIYPCESAVYIGMGPLSSASCCMSYHCAHIAQKRLAGNNVVTHTTV